MREKWIRSQTPEDAAYLEHSWGFWARPDQLSPWSPQRGAAARREALRRWQFFLANAGRGFGKTRIGAETMIEEAKEMGEAFRGGIIGRTAADHRKTTVDGESGILARSPPDFRPVWNRSDCLLTWPNGARATTLSADEPDQFRGFQSNFVWGDEVAAWRYVDAYDQLIMGLRLNPYPRGVFTTTPRPTRLVRDLIADDRTVTVRGSTFDNAENVGANFIRKMRQRYEGTSLGRQELYAEMMDEAPGALWRRSMFQRMDAVPELDRIAVAIDPSTTATDDSDEAGVIAGGSFMRGGVRHALILGDYSGRIRPSEWAARGLAVYDMLQAGRIVGEKNQGGDMVEELITMMAREMKRSGHRASSEVAYRGVNARVGKKTRAEPVVALYEQGRVWHLAEPKPLAEGVSGRLADMEDQMCTWTPGEKSPDRMDGAVWLLTDLILDAEQHEATPTAMNYGARARASRVRGA